MTTELISMLSFRGVTTLGANLHNTCKNVNLESYSLTPSPFYSPLSMK